jgi:pimeloyl-ACP methyl ester carboxylesterase
MTIHFGVSSGRAKLMGEYSGNGYPVIFLHAGVADRRMYQSQLTVIGREYRAIAYDRRGFGETSAPADEAFAHKTDLTVLLDQLELPAAVLVGCSQGGRIAIDFALADPGRVRALVLVATAISGAPDTEMPAAIKPLLAELDAAEEAGDLDRVNQIEAHLWLDGPLSVEGRVSGAPRDLFLAMNRIALQSPPLSGEQQPPSAYDRLGELQMPVLLIHGGLDFPHVQQRHAHLADILTDARTEIFAAAAHLPNLEFPDRCNELLLDFCAEIL